MSKQPGALVALFACLVMAGCGGGDDNNDDTPPATTPPPPPSTPAPSRGDLLTSPPTKLKSYTTSEILTALGGNDFGQALVSLALSPKCGIDVYQLQYQTVGAKAESVSASGALMIPTGTDAACTGSRPLLLYAHGTRELKTANIADLTASGNDEGLAVAALFAGQGYIVIAPNYTGYDTSSLTYHPYLVADAQANDMIDALDAARSALPLAATPAATDNGKLFITGYSQGGYVAMATHRALQAAGTTVTASAPLSGPYALSAFGDQIFQGQVSMSSDVNLTLIVSAYQKAYGNIFTATTDVFEAKYATGIDSLLPSTTPLGDLEAQGKLPPGEVVFNSTPPAPEFASFTPATTPAEFANLFADSFGTDNLITNAYRLSYLRDAQTAPDGGFPTATDGLPPANPTQAFRQALKTNDLRTWTPSVPVLLCGGAHDPTVFFSNTQLMQAYWTSHPPAAGTVTVVDVDSAGDPFSDLRTSFQAAKDAVRVAAVASGDDPDEAVQDVYHAGLVAPFCLSAAKRFFDQR